MKHLLISSLLLFAPLFAQAAVPAVCPTPVSVNPTANAAYRLGFIMACPLGINGAYEASFALGQIDTALCITSNAPFTSSGQQIDWSNGCHFGYTAGDAILQQNLQTWPAKPKPNPTTICSSYQGYTDLTSTAARASFMVECTASYYRAIHQQDDVLLPTGFNTAANSSLCNTKFPSATGNPNGRAGCLIGFLGAIADFEAGFDPMPDPSAEESTFAQSKLADCGLAKGGGSMAVTLQENSGETKGCVDGYRAAFDGEADTAGAGVTDFPKFDSRSVKHGYYKKGYIAGYNAGYAKGTAARDKCTSVGSTGIPGVSCGIILGAPVSLVPACDATLPPNQEGSCGLDKFVELIQRIIKYLLGIMIPIAVLGLGYGGFKIMTAAGNPGKVEEGYQTIKVVVIGIIIALLSYFVVKLIFTALGVTTNVGDVF